MVGAGDPQRRFAFHAVIADHQVLQGDEQGMPQVELSGHIGWRDRDHKRFLEGVETGFVGVICRLKIAFFLPFPVDLFLKVLEFVCFW